MKENQQSYFPKDGSINLLDGKLVIDKNSSILCTKDGKLKLKGLYETFGGNKINLLNIDMVSLSGKIDISKIVNDENDQKINLWKYTTNIADGKIDLAKFIDSKNEKIDLFRFTDVIDKEGKVDFAKIFDSGRKYIDVYNLKGLLDSNEHFDLSKISDSTVNGTLKLAKANFKCYNCGTKRILLDKLTDSAKSGKIDLLKISDVLVHNKIDINRIQNSVNDDKVDLFKYSRNLFDQKIDLAILTDRSGDKINVYRLSGLIDSAGRMDLSKITASSLNTEIRYSKTNFQCTHAKSGRYLLNKFTDSLNKGKIDILKFSLLNHRGRIDINKIQNSEEDENVNLFKFTRNLEDGQIDLGKIADSSAVKVNVYRLNELIDDRRRLDLSKITDSSLNGVIDLYQINLKCFNPKFMKFTLESFTDSRNNGKIDIFKLKSVILNGRIDINKICNNVSDDKVDLFTFTRNLIVDKIDLGILTDSSNVKLNVYRLSQLIDDTGRMDLSKITDSNLNGIIDLYGINFKCFNSKYMKFTLESFVDSKNGGKIDLFKLKAFIAANGNIDINTICNDSSEDIENDKVDLFKFTRNLKDGKIDLGIITDSSGNQINVYRLDGIIDNSGRMDLSKVTNSNLNGIIDLYGINFKCFNSKFNKFTLQSFFDSENGGKIDLFKLNAFTINGKIDINTICNDDSEDIENDKVDLFKFTRNLKDGKIDIGIITDGNKDKINLYRLNEVIDDRQRLDLSKITDSSLKGTIDLHKINFKCFNSKSNKFTLESFTDSQNNGRFDLFKLNNIILNGKIDINKIENNDDNHDVDLFKYSKNLKDWKIDLGILTDSSKEKINVYRLNGLIDDRQRMDLSLVTDSSSSGAINLYKINFKCFNSKFKKFTLESFTDSENNGKIDLFKLSSVIFDGKIDINTICNDYSDDRVNLFKFTRNLKDGKIDLGIIADRSGDKINVFRLNEVVDDNGRIDLSKITDSHLKGQIDLTHIYFDCFHRKTKKIFLNQFSDSENNGKIDLFQISNVINKGKIDINRIQNSWCDKNIDILKYTIHQLNDKILINLFRNGDQNYIYLSSFYGMTNKDSFIQSEDVGKYITEELDGVWVTKYEYNY